MEEKRNVTIDPTSLREDCLSFGLCIRVCLDLIDNQNEEIDEKAKEGVALVSGSFLYGAAVKNPNEAIYYAALAYERREMEKADGQVASFPLWGEDERTEEEKLSDAFFPLYCLYLASQHGGEPEDYLGAVLFFSGAIKEDIGEGLAKKKGDPHYDAYYVELTSYPFAQTMKKTATEFFDAVHVVEKA